MNTVEALIEVKKLIDSPDRWLKHSYSQDKHGNRVDPWDKKAHSFCLTGAMRRVKPGDPEERSVMKDHVIAANRGFDNVVTFNDSALTRHEDVMTALDNAIECSMFKARVRRFVKSYGFLQ